jgi:putative phosphoesterase
MTVGLAHSRSAVVGVVSDTHGLLRPAAVEAVRGVDLLIHAGDVGSPDVLEGLSRIAPVVSVRGNVDHGALGARLPATAEAEVAGVWIHVLHRLEDLDLDPRAAGFGVVVHGHTHRAETRSRDGVLYVNPGSIGPKRFSLPVSLAFLRIASGAVRAETLVLEPLPSRRT